MQKKEIGNLFYNLKKHYINESAQFSFLEKKKQKSALQDKDIFSNYDIKEFSEVRKLLRSVSLHSDHAALSLRSGA